MLPADLTIAIPPFVQSILLPKGADSWPPRRSNAPPFYCRIERAERSLSATLCIDGPSLRHVHVEDGTTVYCRNTEHYRKIHVHLYTASGALLLSSGTALGHAYLTEIDGHIDAANLNGMATSKSRKPHLLFCRHLILDEALRQHRYRRDKQRRGSLNERLVQRRIQRIPTAGALSYLARTDLELRWNELQYYAAEENAVVEHPLWGGFCAERFASMTAGETEYWTVSSAGHAMLLTLEVKTTEDGQTHYVAKFFDPNLSHTHARIVEDRLDAVAAWTLSTFVLLEQQRSAYYNPGQRQTAQTASLFQLVPSKGLTSAPGHRWRETANTARRVAHYAASGNMGSPNALFHLLATGLPIDVIETALERCQSADEVFRVFQASTEGCSGLFVAMQEGHVTRIDQFFNYLLTHPKAADLSNEQVERLISASRQRFRITDQGVAVAVSKDQADAIGAWKHGMLKLFAACRLNNNQVMGLLNQTREFSESVFGRAASFQRKKTIWALADLAFAARSAGALTADQLTAFLEAVDDRGQTVLARLMESGSGERVRTYGKIILAARQRGAIDNDQLKRLLMRKNRYAFMGMPLSLTTQATEEAHEAIVKMAQHAGYLSNADAKAINASASDGR
ncbi:ShET2/EspL2 family type III secretion system effector toxin [Trinickia sp. LjRoot230]